MIADAKMSDTIRLDDVLRPMGITRTLKAYRILRECLLLILEKEDRLEAVQKEIYEPVAEKHVCDWTAIQSAVRRAAQTAWNRNPEYLEQMAGYALDGAPSAAQFLEMLYNRIVRV